MNIYNETVNILLNKKDNSLHRYFLEVDLEYPELIPNLLPKINHIVEI